MLDYFLTVQHFFYAVYLMLWLGRCLRYPWIALLTLRHEMSLYVNKQTKHVDFEFDFSSFLSFDYVSFISRSCSCLLDKNCNIFIFKFLFLKFKNHIALIMAGVGGASLSQWTPDKRHSDRER